ncbi:ATP-binding protein [Sphaerisporangium sp. NPDC005289]|uniref:ATP-binding protein n=1 Tax=Sphaerisporangium sp. NPDC005289 TaxID=3155247 RepID=UPI0033B8F0BD
MSARTNDRLGSVDLLGQVSSVTLARAYVRGLLLSAGRREVDDIELLVGELVANAIKHSESGRRPDGMVYLRVYDDGDTIRVEVTDQGSPGPLPHIPAQVDPLSENGRGLWLVRELSSTWGSTQNGTTRTVWFQIAS